MVIKTIRSITIQDITDANEARPARQPIPEKKPLPDDVQQVRHEIIVNGGAVVEFEGDRQLRQAKKESCKLRGHLTNTEFGLVNLEFIPVGDEEAAKLVVRRRKEG